jgi:serine/threonine protein phosphatase PrpC
MEDAHAAVLDLDQDAETSNAFFAVYDGHGGTSLSHRLFLEDNILLQAEPSRSLQGKMYTSDW